MKRPLAALLALAGLAIATGCTSVVPADREEAAGALPLLDDAVPAFSCDGRVRRDLETGAPLFVAAAGCLARRAPRFTAEGSVARDPESGSAMYDEVAGGEIVRVLVATP